MQLAAAPTFLPASLSPATKALLAATKASEINSKKTDCIDGSFLRAHHASRSYHSGGVNTCFADGSVKFMRENISLQVWKNLGTRSGGEVVDSSQY
ncbi:DUF1559 domain-containing protein [bacterium]|nr:DUF1559 domain-containing protein [bacterium]